MVSNIKIASFIIDSGEELKNLNITFHTYGKLNKDKSNVIWVCHALTANSDVLSWWDGLFGPDKLFDPNQYFIVCANSIGSCYGSTGPTTSEFPNLTVRDMVNAHEVLRKRLSLNSIHILIGASLGGQQALEWSILQPKLFTHQILIATNAKHSAYGIAFNQSQRLAIYADSSYGSGGKNDGHKGLIAARSMAMLSYRSYESYVETQSDSNNEGTSDFRASSYQLYQGEKLAKRFNAYSYVCLSKAMDSHNIGRSRASIPVALNGIEAKTLVIGISSDCLFPTREQKYLAAHIKKAKYLELESDFGHDGFLIEMKQLETAISNFLNKRHHEIRPTVFKSSLKKKESPVNAIIELN